MLDPNKIAPGYSSKVLGGSGEDLTFVGVLRQFFLGKDKGKYVSEGWDGERTIPEYINDYEKRLIPCLPANKRMADYTLEDYRDVISRLCKAHPKYEEDGTTLGHYKWLFKKVYNVGVENGIYIDALFLDINDTDAEEEKVARNAKRIKLIKKSFSAEQEMKLAEWFRNLDYKTAKGEDIGLFIMFCNGLRGNEACGLNFADIHKQEAANSFPCIYITKTTEIESNKLKAGAKTSNGIRVVPTFDYLINFIEKRRQYIIHLSKVGGIRLPEGMEVWQLPIVCRGNDYLTRASSRDLTQAGNALFSELGISDQARDAALVDTLYKTKLADNDISQREITTYLFRRNAATFYYMLGFAPDVCEYLLGHEIVDGIRRSFYINQDILYEIYQRLKRHPLNCYFENLSISKSKVILRLNGSSLRIVADEPCQSIRIQLLKGKKVRVLGCDSSLSAYQRRTVNCSQIIQEVYIGKTERGL